MHNDVGPVSKVALASFFIFMFAMLLASFARADLTFVRTDKKSTELVVFVHGLDGNSRDTWTNANRTYFPGMLANDREMTKFDVAVFDYPSLCANVSISEAANTLREDMKPFEKRYDAIHFVAHSMGGLVVRQFMLRNHKTFKIGTMQLFATPNFGDSLEKVADLFCGWANLDRAPSLDPHRGSALDKLNDDWRDEFEQYDGKLSTLRFAAYEVPQGMFERTWVEKNSALAFASTVRAFETGHKGIVKPASGSDPIYIWTKANLLKRKASQPNGFHAIRTREINALLTKLATKSSETARTVAANLNDRDIEGADRAIARTDALDRDGKIFLSALVNDVGGEITKSMDLYSKLVHTPYRDSATLLRNASGRGGEASGKK